MEAACAALTFISSRPYGLVGWTESWLCHTARHESRSRARSGVYSCHSVPGPRPWATLGSERPRLHPHSIPPQSSLPWRLRLSPSIFSSPSLPRTLCVCVWSKSRYYHALSYRLFLSMRHKKIVVRGPRFLLPGYCASCLSHHFIDQTEAPVPPTALKDLDNAACRACLVSSLMWLRDDVPLYSTIRGGV